MIIPALIEQSVSVSAEKIERIEARLLRLPNLALPLIHRFSPGVYLREIFMPADSFVIGHCHKTEHFNIVTQGRALVMMDGVTEEIVAPCIFVSSPGVRKVLYILEDMSWATIHPTHETDLDRLEEELIVKSASYIKHFAELEELRKLLQVEISS